MRTARLALYGGCVFSPIAYNWYKMLERIKFTSRPLCESLSPPSLRRTADVRREAVVATRVGLDQFALSPMLVRLLCCLHLPQSWPLMLGRAGRHLLHVHELPRGLWLGRGRAQDKHLVAADALCQLDALCAYPAVRPSASGALGSVADQLPTRLNFAVIKVPTQRLLIVNVVSLFWKCVSMLCLSTLPMLIEFLTITHSAFLSWKNAQAGDDDETQYPPEALDRKAV